MTPCNEQENTSFEYKRQRWMTDLDEEVCWGEDTKTEGKKGPA